ncbi:site-specific integrase [Sulfitobacter sp. R18_1]|uniref:site-specific integrase n=1 Tax=Sulfitobacter sp. R18_1 TaxID=2821104 RepID=UPI001ADB3795|nr:site-specific integrase [Sulfitobacter sp. R18_1]MBO9428555.1 site-specific integrase [Sulfitobacter sp. R18_1]
MNISDKDRSNSISKNHQRLRILSPSEIENLLEVAEDTRYPIRNRGIVLLATDAGLTPYEMSYLCRYHLYGDDGLLGDSIDLRGKTSKYLRPRRIPMPRKGRLWSAMHDLLENVPAVPGDPLIISERAVRGGKATKTPGRTDLTSMRPTSISYVFWKMMDKAGISHASALSARNTFIHSAGVKAIEERVSLRNVQALSGHGDLKSIVRVLEVSEESQEKIMKDLFEPR